MIADGAAALAADPALGRWLDAQIAEGEGSDTSIVLYTSGTTGTSKGVVLSAQGCIAAASDTVAFDKLTEQDKDNSPYLPLAWVGDHYLNYAQRLVAGFCMACPESADTVMQDLREIGPTFYFAPPRGFEQMLTQVMIRMEDAGAIKRRVFHYFIGVARRTAADPLTGKPVSPREPAPLRDRPSSRLRSPQERARLFARAHRLHGRRGDRAKTCSRSIDALGLNGLKQLYGQTEAFLYLTAQPGRRDPFRHRRAPRSPQRRHPPLPTTAKSSSSRPACSSATSRTSRRPPRRSRRTATSRPATPASLDPKTGHLKIIDRARDVGRLNDGTLFGPKYLENKLKFFPNIREAVAYGHERDFVCVMLNIDLAAVANWAERNRVVYGSYQELAGHPLVYDMLAGHVAEVVTRHRRRRCSAGAQIRRFLILHKELDADDGEVTRTQKVRRGLSSPSAMRP